MAENMPARKLATIVALDVAGYSARTEADESATMAEVTALRPVIEAIAAAHGGRVFNSAGDGFMLEFGSTAGAVEAAEELAARCEPKVRVGVHVGDVTVQPNGDLLGHGVNVCARLMAQSQPGSVLISSDVRRMIRGPAAERFVSWGTIRLDKMSEILEAFGQKATAQAAAGPAAKASRQAKREELLLAVLPFDNLSTDPEMQFFSDGVSEEIMRQLMRGSKLKIVGRTSSFQFRGERKEAAAAALRCSHVLDGSVRRSASQVRVAAHLVEASSRTTLWSDRFEGDLSDIFAVQDRISESIANALQHTFSGVQRQSVDPTAYDFYLKGIQTTFVSEDLRPGIAALEQATALAPQLAEAWGKLAELRAHFRYHCPFEERETLALKISEEASRALALDPHNPAARLARLLLLPPWGHFLEAERIAGPLFHDEHTDGYTFQFAATHYMSVGRMRDAVAVARRGFELDALNPLASHLLGFCLWYDGQTAEAKRRTESALARAPDNHFSTINLILMAADAHDWEATAQLLAPERLAKYPLRQFDRWAHIYVELNKAATPQLRNRALDGLRKDFERTGYVDVPGLAIAAHFGSADEAHELAAKADFRPAGSADDQLGFDAYRPYFLFHAAWPEFRRDPRFARICARLGLVEYWRTTRQWPDCVEELKPFYDFKAECLKFA